MRMIKTFMLAATALVTATLTLSSYAEEVEVYLLDRIDGLLNHYCIDVNGPPHSMQLETPLQVHTCYSYQGQLTPDQVMDREEITGGKLRILAVDLCTQLDGTEPGATVTLAECADIEEQNFELRENGQIASVPHPVMCLTAGPTSSFGGAVDAPNENQARTLTLQRCGDEAVRYQSWGTRSELSKAD